MSTEATHQPTDEELGAALRGLRGQHPEAGIAKLHAALQDARAGWVVSVKRTRKVLAGLGLVLGPAAAAPAYRLNDRLDVARLSARVRVKDFGMPRGKGLIAAEDIKAGDVLWKEDPFVLAPEPDVLDQMNRGLLCSYCLTQISASNLVQACPAQSPCTARFCTRLCLQRAQATHPLLCPALNPAGWDTVRFARERRWQAVYALLVVAAKLRLAAPDDRADACAVWDALAHIQPATDLWKQTMRPTEKDIARAQALHKAAFDNPKAAKLARNAAPLDDKTHAELFDNDGYRRGLARVNLNLEVNGGLYALHSHLNHSCAPNVAARHVDHRTALARLSVIALSDLKKDQELTITYVDPKLPLEARRRELRAWGIRECRCDRCVQEEKAAPPPPAGADAPPAEPEQPAEAAAAVNGSATNGHADDSEEGEPQKPKEGLEDLEKELKDHLGL